MLAGLFPRERLDLAMGTYNLGSMVGAGMAFVVGGQIVELVARTPHFAPPLVGEVRSWQAVLLEAELWANTIAPAAPGALDPSPSTEHP